MPIVAIATVLSNHARGQARLVVKVVDPSRLCDRKDFLRVMAFWLKKIVTLGLMPLPFCLGMLAVGLWLTRFPQRARLGRISAGTSLLLLALLSNHFVARTLMRPLETRYIAVPDFNPGEPLPASLISCKFIVVLGAGYGTTADRPATGQLTAPALARITEAVRLSSLLPEARIIVCGPDLGNGVTHASQLARAAISLGVASHRITRIDQANDTEAEAADIRQIVGDQRVALVTSASHMPRASALFRGKGLSLLPCPTGFVTQEYDTFTVSQLAFDPDSLRSSSAALHERLGMMWSGLRGKTSD